jgi:hypothetical protein
MHSVQLLSHKYDDGRGIYNFNIKQYLMYKELFYLIRRFVMKFRSVKEVEFNIVILISMLIISNVMSIIILIGYFFNVNLYRDYNFDYTYISVPLGVFIMVVNYITIYSKREEIIEKYNYQNGINKYKGLLYKLYMLASFVLLFVSLSLNQTLFEKDQNLKNQEKIKITIPKLDPKGDPSKTY